MIKVTAEHILSIANESNQKSYELEPSQVAAAIISPCKSYPIWIVKAIQQGDNQIMTTDIHYKWGYNHTDRFMNNNWYNLDDELTIFASKAELLDCRFNNYRLPPTPKWEFIYMPGPVHLIRKPITKGPKLSDIS